MQSASSAEALASPHLASMPTQHFNARSVHPSYASAGVQRVPVADAAVPWSASAPGYAPPDYTHARILEAPPYADPKDPRLVDWSQKRFSLEYQRRNMSQLRFDKETGRPLNPIGRTGLSGRGRLGKWGPNFAADMLVTRKVSDAVDDKEPVYEFVAICRSDTGLWALPGGMVDGVEESFKDAAIREFFEEAASGDKELENKLTPIMNKEGEIAYAGIVDDTRSTDNAWTETVLLHFKFDKEKHGDLTLRSDDDATDAAWLRTDGELFRGPGFHSHHRLFVLGALGLELRGAKVLEGEQQKE